MNHSKIKRTVELQRKKVYEQVWSEPMIRLAKRYGISDVALAKICRKMAVPVPPRGYWRKKERGIATPQPPLPKLREGVKPTVTLTVHHAVKDGSNASPDVQAQVAFEAQEEHRIRVPDRLLQPHPLIRQTMEVLQGAKPDQWGVLRVWNSRALDLQVGQKSLTRALRILDALIKALEGRGFSVGLSASDKRKTHVQIFGDQVEFRLEEEINRISHVRTGKEEVEFKKSPWRIPQWDYVQTGRLRIRLEEFWPQGARKTWSDGKKHRLEEMLNEVVLGMVIVAAANRTRRLEWAREEAERQEAARQRAILEQQRREEEARRQALERHAELWAKSRLLRAYIDAVEERVSQRGLSSEPGTDACRWLEWARQQADRIDPLKTKPSGGVLG